MMQVDKNWKALKFLDKNMHLNIIIYFEIMFFIVFVDTDDKLVIILVILTGSS